MSHQNVDTARRRLRTLTAVAAAMLLILGGCAAPTTLEADDAVATSSAPSATASATPTPTPEESASPVAPAEEASAEPDETPSAEETPAQDAAAPSAGTAESAALELEVKGRAPTTGYSREEFGSGWVDVDRNGCDTRNDMLRLRLENRTMDGSCKVTAGDLLDPFTGQWIRFERGGASEVDIDHLVALSDAWQKGAFQWEFAQRVAFANDPLNLEPVDAGQNRSKGDADAATWLPPHTDFRCQYVARQIAVKTKYGVWVTQAEQDAMLRVLSACPGEPLPDAGSQPIIASNTGGPPPAAKPEPEPQPAETSAPATETRELDPDYGTCKEAKANGRGPYVKGTDPEYEWYRDADKDGIVCE